MTDKWKPKNDPQYIPWNRRGKTYKIKTLEALKVLYGQNGIPDEKSLNGEHPIKPSKEDNEK